VAPTSLNEGRGEVVAPALVVVFQLGLKRRLVDGWAGGGSTSRRRAGSPNTEVNRNQTILGRGAKRDIPLREAVPKAVTLVVPRTSRAEEVRVVCVSNVIYHNVYLIRLINISGFLSN